MGIEYLDDPVEWVKLHQILLTQEFTGLDSEFSGVDFKKGDSCVGRAKIHVWSVAIFTGKLNPRGFIEAQGYVLPAEAIPYFKEWLESPFHRKYAHNSNVDVHAFWNSGIDVQGIINTLGFARYVYPNRLSQSLDSLAQDHLGTGKIISYKELTSEPDYVEKVVMVKDCSCGVEKCRKRKGHEKILRETFELVEKGTKEIPLESIVEDHPRFPILIEYAGQDAVMALCLGDYLSRKSTKYVEVPWLV